VYLDEAKGKAKGTAKAKGKAAAKPSSSLISFDEVQKHNTRSDCWVVIDGKVYDVSEFIDMHPGGAAIIAKNAGKDVTKIFKPVHPPDALELLDESKHLGRVDPATMPEVEDEPTEVELRVEAARKLLPPIDAMHLLGDFEEWAAKVLSATGWNYYKSAADSEATMDNNERAFGRYYFRPRILRDITSGGLETEVVGTKMAMPVFIAPAAMAKLGHPLGEVNLTKGAGNAGIVQGVSQVCSCKVRMKASDNSRSQSTLRARSTKSWPRGSRASPCGSKSTSTATAPHPSACWRK
jgi:L-lactate dehydrogenase (cytochrome)